MKFAKVKICLGDFRKHENATPQKYLTCEFARHKFCRWLTR
jgi:hypothetical protein